MNRYPTLIRSLVSFSSLLMFSSLSLFAADATPAVNQAANGNPPATTAAPALKDADGNSLRLATKTGHISNYYER